MKIIADIFEYTAKNAEIQLISISVITCRKPVLPTSNWHILWRTGQYLRAGVNASMDIDAFAPRLSFFGLVAIILWKQDACNVLWAKL